MAVLGFGRRNRGRLRPQELPRSRFGEQQAGTPPPSPPPWGCALWGGVKPIPWRAASPSHPHPAPGQRLHPALLLAPCPAAPGGQAGRGQPQKEEPEASSRARIY